MSKNCMDVRTQREAINCAKHRADQIIAGLGGSTTFRFGNAADPRTRRAALGATGVYPLACCEWPIRDATERWAIRKYRDDPRMRNEREGGAGRPSRESFGCAYIAVTGPHRIPAEVAAGCGVGMRGKARRLRCR